MNQIALTSIHGTLRENISVTEAPTILNLYDLTKKKNILILLNLNTRAMEEIASSDMTGIWRNHYTIRHNMNRKVLVS